MITKKKSSNPFLAWVQNEDNMNIVYGLGAAVVILGALFKLQGWPGANIMLIVGHLDFTFRDGDPKIDYDKNIYKEDNHQISRDVATRLGLKLREGVYTWTLGPTYETPAEIKMIRDYGGDAVGMSTLPEIVEAGNQNLNIWGFSCFTNKAAGMEKGTLTHSEVLSNAEKFKGNFKEFIRQLIITYKRGK